LIDTKTYKKKCLDLHFIRTKIL